MRLHITALSIAALSWGCSGPPPQRSPSPTLWQVYETSLQRAKYVDLTHTITPDIPVWAGFGRSTFGRAVDAKTGQPFTWSRDGFEATQFQLATDQFGTQLDPPAHWNPDFPAIDELPPTFAVRPLVVISIVDQVAAKADYSLTVDDIRRWEDAHGTIPAGSVVFVRSDWSKEWPNRELATRTRFPGVSLAALKFLHQQRRILFHGHEPLDTDATPTLEGEAWLLRNGYTQAEGVAHLDQVPESGALVEIGFSKIGGGLGGFARFVAICPPEWNYGVSIGEMAESPLARAATPLHWDDQRGMRVR
jgi:kynurenine formamidase